MAVDKRIKGMDVRLYPDARYHLDWYKEEVPGPYSEYYSLFYRGRHVAAVFRGKATVFGIIFGRATLRGGDLYRMGLHIAGLFINPRS